MSSIQRHRYGATNPGLYAQDATVLIEIGDMVYLDSGKIWPASNYTAQSSLALTQAAFHGKFAGVSAERNRVGLTDPLGITDLRVDHEGTFEFDCDAATFEMGDKVGPAAGTGALIVNQKVAAVSATKYAVGRVQRREPSNVTKVLVRIFSVVMLGGTLAPDA
jgi:hypothetical protein